MKTCIPLAVQECDFRNLTINGTVIEKLKQGICKQSTAKSILVSETIDYPFGIVSSPLEEYIFS